MVLALYSLLLGLGLVGLALAIYMTRVFFRVRRGETVHCVDDSCPVVMQTPYAESLGFPNSYLAIPYYAILALAAAAWLAGAAHGLFWPVAIASVLSLLMSIYLAHSLVWRLRRP